MRRALKPARVRVRVPATTSNLGAGFDVLGMALTLYNELEVSVRPGVPGCVVVVEGEGKGSLPADETNEVARVLGLSSSRQVEIRQNNGIPVARGLGSSAAARLGAVLALRALEPGRKDDDWVLSRALSLEGHPDNVVPALLGGARLGLQDGGRVVNVPLRAPRDLAAVVCIPAFELSTEKARRILPRRVPRADAVFTSARVGLLVYAFERRQYQLLKTAMQDVLHQPYRRRLVPGMSEAIDAAYAAGAFGAALSGAGPSVFALAPKRSGASVGRAMEKAFHRRRVASRALTLGIDTRGATVTRLS
ncbi:MAG: homoserine kinase [Elusimicrobia bacterium]|nr:homoserine kinase [Elusimicrobiota bacterium]